MTETELLQLFKSKNALLEGHFILSSGLHSNRYMQSALLLQYPDVAEQLGKELAARFPFHIDTVLSPAMGGLIIGQEVGRAKKTRAIFSEKDDEGKPILRRGFSLSDGEKVLIIEDVITTGLSTNEVVSLVKSSNAELMGIGSIVNRSLTPNKTLAALGKPLFSLLNLEVQSWQSDNCDLCKQGTLAIKPGSRKK
ncbi:MAG: orotate phosphoribosyltransferase [Elusimicrobiota bacterium]